MTALWRGQAGRVSVQVLNEYYVTMTRRFAGVFAVERIRDDIRRLGAWGPVSLTRMMIDDAWVLEDRFSLAWWDALIIAAARTARCDVVLSEDMQDGLDIDGLVVMSPFTVPPEEILGTG